MSAKITPLVSEGYLVEIDGPRIHCITLAYSRAAADEFVAAIERASADDQREGRVSGAASLGNPIQ